MAFVIDLFDRFNRFDREHARFRFEVNGQEYAIKEVEMEWGIPYVGDRIEQEEDRNIMQVYERYEDALAFVRVMKKLN